MITTHDIIRQLYPTVTFVIEKEENKFICRDKDGNSVTVDADAVVAEFTKQDYKNKRAKEYPSIADQLDDIYHNGIDAWKATIKATKDKYPKS